MICPECWFDRWDGKSPHLYGGRESAGMQCYGPKSRRVVTAVHVDRAVPPSRPAVEPSEPTIDPATRQAIKDRPLRQPVPAPAPVKPTLTKAQRALLKLSARFNLMPASEIPPPPVRTVEATDRTSAPETGSRRPPRRRRASSTPRSGHRS